jgi:outer membrane protein OmpA-like peptidoglycan-associated protein
LKDCPCKRSEGVSFDYDSIKEKEGGSHWATYSDLFMVLSLVFLLLYVIASLRTGTSNIQNQTQYQEVIRERDDLKQQIKVYNTLKDNYLQTGASKDEQQMYEELMDKLVLLKEEAKKEKDDLRQAALENEKKEMALNKYQQMIRNIINTNMVSNVRIKRRDKTIEKNYQEIDSQKEEIQSLESTVAQKQKEIQKGESKIKNLNQVLDSKVSELQKAYKQNKISKKKMQQQIAKLKTENQQQVKNLQAQNAEAAKEILRNQQIIAQATQELEQAQQTISQQQQNIERLAQEKQEVSQKISQMRQEFNQRMQSEKAEFEKALNQEKLSAQAKAKKQQEFLKKAKAKEMALAAEIQNMESKVQNVQGELEKTREEKAKADAQSQALAAKNKDLSGQKEKLSSDLQKMKEIANARKKLVNDMKDNLAKSGLKADVDDKTGDVIIHFGEEYFDTGKANLKPGMEAVLKKLMPAYSKTLFADPKTAEKISSVEIIGYASPTYKGKYVNPVSLEADNKEAVNYNLDLSYYRARSIFDYIFDTSKMQYDNQSKLLPMVKVTGRSFLAEGEEKRDISSMSHKEYCEKFDCKKSQRVVIKFNLEN